MIMVHGDDTGLILPPRVAPVQAVIIYIQKVSTPPEQVQRLKETVRPVFAALPGPTAAGAGSSGDALTSGSLRQCNDIAKRLLACGVRAEVDDRSNYTAGWKYNHWEQKGVPLRIEVGPADLDKDQVRGRASLSPPRRSAR